MPLDLRLGKMLVLGAVFGCLGPLLSVAAVMSCKPLFNSSLPTSTDSDPRRREKTKEGLGGRIETQTQKRIRYIGEALKSCIVGK